MSSVKSFRGGIHPLHAIGSGKGLTANLPIAEAPAPARVVLPMAQHIGAPCVPCVAVGDRVLRGQAVGQAAGAGGGVGAYCGRVTPGSIEMDRPGPVLL